MDALNQPLRSMLDENSPLPADMLALVRQVVAYDPLLLANLDRRYIVAWRAGRELSEGRAVLQALTAYVGAQQRKERDATAAPNV
jgi:hypothetical protein